MPGDNELAEALAFRVGRKVPRNIYRGDEPVCMVATAEAAEELVTLLNLGAAALRARPEARAEDGTGAPEQAVTPSSEPMWPDGCLKPSPCGRHAACMYAQSTKQCAHFGKDLSEAVATATARKEEENSDAKSFFSRWERVIKSMPLTAQPNTEGRDA